jgi:PIN domain nuclease of toxin-antitoxin system
MRRPILLDTNVLLWSLNNDRRLSRRLKKVLSAPAAEIRISVVSAWEIVIKHQGGKLSFDTPIEEVLSSVLSGTIWPVLPLLPSHIPELLDLPMLHRDPFDRLLVAQARTEGMLLATTDTNIQQYEVPTIG